MGPCSRGLQCQQRRFWAEIVILDALFTPTYTTAPPREISPIVLPTPLLSERLTEKLLERRENPSVYVLSSRSTVPMLVHTEF